MVTSTQNRFFTMDEYYKMADAGILREDDRVELLRGEIIQMAPIGSHHASCVKRLNQFLSRNVPQNFIIGVQDPIQLDKFSVPQPDLSVLQYRADVYKDSHPTPVETLLVIEVADSSLHTDKNIKMPLYAEAGIPEAWLVDLTADTVIVYREPAPQGYQSIFTLGRDKTLAPLAFPELTVHVDWIFG